MDSKRALVVVRLSRVMENSTSVEKQLEICSDLCRERDWEIVGVASDTDVSGAVDPWDRKARPEFARWLHGEQLDGDGNPVPFDVLVAYRADRLTRSIKYLQRLVAWAEDNRKLIVSATEPHFDMSSPYAAVLVALIGMVGQMELTAIADRNRSTARRDMRLGKYRGSTPPWGYRADKRDGVWRLVQDDAQVEVIREVVQRVLDGEPLQRIAEDLTLRKIPTVKDRMKELQGKEPKGTAWNQTVLKRSLLSEAMLGYVISDGKALRGEDGSPIQRADPILTREVFERVRVELDSRSSAMKREPAEQSLLTGVLRCGVCGQNAYRFGSGVGAARHHRYRCRSVTKKPNCGNRTIRADITDRKLQKLILGMLGETERKVKVWRPGSDNSDELLEINAELVDITGLIGTPAYRAGTPQRAALDARITALSERQAMLSATEVVPAGWDWKPTGETFGDWWERQDNIAKNHWLRSMNVGVTFDRKGFGIEFGDVRTMMAEVDATGTTLAAVDDFVSQLHELGIAGVEIDGDTITLARPDGQRLQVESWTRMGPSSF
ncbi:MAG: recombinase family protein [Gammaproteobacteria bacterium]|nr:MAG: recombinase family protein [Gammaproteobacteria bacterium]